MPGFKTWIIAFRLRTLPLALSSILMGSFLAAYDGYIDNFILILSIFTTLFLQILSNLANDYGDAKSGVDNEDREGPTRMVHSGQIPAGQMLRAMVLSGSLALITGSWMLWIAFGQQWIVLLVFFALGILAIAAAVKYTVGRRPYGYAGLGDLFVLIFFGLVGVFGSYFLHIQQFRWEIVLPALSCGLFSVGVLNVNNIRDIESDKKSGKKSIPVRIGSQAAKVYHGVLLLVGVMAATVFAAIRFTNPYSYLFLVVLFPLILHYQQILRENGKSLDPNLKQLAAITLIFVMVFGLALLVDKHSF